MPLVSLVVLVNDSTREKNVDSEYLLPITYFQNPFRSCRGDVKNALANQRPDLRLHRRVGTRKIPYTWFLTESVQWLQ